MPDKKFLNHAAPITKRHRVVTETVGERGSHSAASGAPPPRVHGENLVKVHRSEQPVSQHRVDGPVEALARDDRCEIKNRPCQPGAAHALARYQPCKVHLCGFMHEHTGADQASASRHRHLYTIEPVPVDTVKGGGRAMARHRSVGETDRKQPGVRGRGHCRVAVDASCYPQPPASTKPVPDLTGCHAGRTHLAAGDQSMLAPHQPRYKRLNIHRDII